MEEPEAMTCNDCFAPHPIGTRVVLLTDGMRGRIAGWHHPGFVPRPSTVRYAIERDDGLGAFARHDELASTAGPALRLVASDGERVVHERGSHA